MKLQDLPVMPFDYAETNDYVFHNLRAELDYVATMDLMRSQGWLKPNEEYPAEGFTESQERELNKLARAYLRTKRNWSEIHKDILAQNAGHALPLSISDLPVASISRDPLTLVETLFGRDAVNVVAADVASPAGRQAANERLRQLSIKALCVQLSKLNVVGNAAQVERSLFEFTSANRRGPDTYRMLESTRASLYEYLADQLGETRFDAMWRETMWNVRLRARWSGEPSMAITVPARFFNRRLIQATRRGFSWPLRFFMSIPRGLLLRATDDQFEKELELLRRSIEENWAHGVDVSGSLQETEEGEQTVEQRFSLANEQRKAAEKLREQALAARSDGDIALSGVLRGKADELFASSEKLKSSAVQYEKREAMFTDRLRRLISVGLRSGGEVRLHMFERSRTGPFYDAVRSVLSDLSSDMVSSTKGRIRIGHISSINDSDIEYFKKLGRRRKLLVFEVNPVSNTELGNNELSSLAQTIRKLQAAGLAVVIGADEAGILGDHAQLGRMLKALLEKGLSEQNMLQLMADNARYFPKVSEADQTFLRCVGVLVRLGQRLDYKATRRHWRKLKREQRRKQ